MPPWVAASTAYFLYIAVMAVLMRRVAPRARLRVLALSAAGAAATALTAIPSAVLRVWVLPAIVLLLAYWGTGALFVAPMPNVEQVLRALDDRWHIHGWAARMPSWLVTLLELAYLGVYPLIPIALAFHLGFDESPNPDRFWSVVLVTDFICFGTLPWLQTRPPRAIETRDPWHSVFRRFNVRLMRTASIRVNTFPSGHAAEALAVALLVLDAPWPVVAWMFFNVVAISAGAVLGRYHYAVDAVTGWMVAFVVWWIIG